MAEATRPGLVHLRNTLVKGATDERWEQYGKGVRGDPFTFMRMA